MATALVLGASGVSGWGVLDELRTYPSPTAFKRIIGLTYRPLTKETAMVPEEDHHRVELYSGFDLGLPVDEIAKRLKAIDNIGDVGPVYFTAYTAHGQGHDEVIRANVALVSNSIQALEKVCPNFSFFTLQTGGKHYGLEWIEHIKIEIPLKESAPRVPSPWGDKIFYYAQVDEIKRLAKGKKWGWCELRPDAIIGFVPQNNAMSIVQGLGLYFSFYKWLHGPNPPPVRFPGNEGAWNAKRTDTSSTVLARFHIYASLHPERVDGKSFNVADSSEPTQWKVLWPIICNYFGVSTLDGPDPEGKAQSIGAFMEGNKDKWTQWVRETRVRPGTLEGTSWPFINYLTQEWTFDHPFDLTEMYATGFPDVLDTPTQWLLGFDRMKAANLIPK
ncbi:hypothetical protein AYL99_01591 [Fonsecaea erecta]|uniref:PRISE-like Rossmann-fold domain-containing protein n=1 Tax=Fonsecaea erecta TaxID=1367422 RepID=A0A179A0R4_9EURO|nr:hypothetical protein AYL99_01591 [Fonsecaea erecta]OAP65619.1 hypothetical protein AYL99_01591 [Fonsecaea erecta]